MKSKNIIWGLFFIAAAAVVVLGKAGIVGGFGIWTLLISLVMVPVLINSIYSVNFVGIMFSLAIYAILDAQPLGIEKYTPWTVLIVAGLLSIGLTLIFPNRKGIKKNKSKYDSKHWDQSSLDGENVYIKSKFQGSSRYITSQNLKNVDIECSFSGTEIYLDNAKLSNGYATINLYMTCGGLELYIPKEWTVVNELKCTLSGVEEEPSSYHDGINTIVLKGSSSLSGIEICRV